jgi:beta-lactamase regulating signal transducer with metallopeptidase domain
MKAFSQITFNLLFNSISSFTIAALIVGVVIGVFRVNTSRAKLFLLSLPFIKVIWETLRGLPNQAFVYAYSDPWQLPYLDRHAWFGAGFFYTGPQANFAFSVMGPDGNEHNISAAEYVWAWLARHVSEQVPLILFSALFAVSLYLVVRRFYSFIHFERDRRNDYENSVQNGEFHRILRMGRLTVKIYCSPSYQGTPFTGGFISPYICFPSSTYGAMAPDEYESVLQHELAHIRKGDLWITLLIQVLGDVFWFIPGYRFISKKIDRLREILADSDAVKKGARPEFLASALLKLREVAPATLEPVMYSAFFREKSLIKQRIQRLMGEPEKRKPFWIWRQPWGKALILFWTVGSVLISTIGGNYAPAHIESSYWLGRFVQYLMN